jgi:Cft2 family RNA processing exonuclease
MEITFLGATGTVTGSKYLVAAAGQRLLIDCGPSPAGRPGGPTSSALAAHPRR